MRKYLYRSDHPIHCSLFFVLSRFTCLPRAKYSTHSNIPGSVHPLPHEFSIHNLLYESLPQKSQSHHLIYLNQIWIKPCIFFFMWQNSFAFVDLGNQKRNDLLSKQMAGLSQGRRNHSRKVKLYVMKGHQFQTSFRFSKVNSIMSQG